MRRLIFFMLFFTMLTSRVGAQQMAVWSAGENIYSRSTELIDSITFKHGDSTYVVKPDGTFFRNCVAGRTFVSNYKPKTSSSSSVVEPLYPLYYLYFFDDNRGCLVHYGTSCGTTDQFVNEFTYVLNYPDVVMTTASGKSYEGVAAGGSGLLLQIDGAYYPFVLASGNR